MRRRHITLWALGLLVLAASPSLALIWHPEALDTAGSVGRYTSVAVDSLSQPHVAYYDVTGGNLKYAVRPGSKWQVSTVDSTGDVGQWCSIALDGDDRPHISYYDATNLALKYARWTGSAWVVETVDDHSSYDVGQHTAIAVDDADVPHISYYHATFSRLYYARRTGSTWNIDRVQSGDVGKFTSIAVGSDGVPHISYYDIGGGQLNHAWDSGAGWRTEVVDTTGDVGRYTALALDNLRRPRISYYDVDNSALKFAAYSGSVWSTETVDNTADVGAGTSLDLDPTNRPHIAYYDVTHGDLLYARWNGATWEIEAADTDGRVGESPSMRLGFNSLPYISYGHVSKQDLRFATPSGAWLFFTPEAGFEDGVKPNQGVADSTRFKFRVIYQDADGWGPTNPVVIILRNGVAQKVVRLAAVEPFPNYALGGELRGGTRLPAGDYTYRFRALAKSGLYAGGAPTAGHGPIQVTDGAAALVAGVAAAPTTAGAEIALRLSAAATVDARVLNLAGRPVGTLARGRQLPAGSSALLWTGQSDSGLRAPAGTYVVVIEARGDDGAVSRAVCRVALR